jgi:hypothetical protein
MNNELYMWKSRAEIAEETCNVLSAELAAVRSQMAALLQDGADGPLSPRRVRAAQEILTVIKAASQACANRRVFKATVTVVRAAVRWKNYKKATLLPAITVRICPMSGADSKLPVPEAPVPSRRKLGTDARGSSVADLRAAVAQRVDVKALLFDLLGAGGETPPVGSEQGLGPVGSSTAARFMRQLMGVALTHQSDFDTNGVMYWKATQGGTRPYTDPQASGAVTTAASSRDGRFYAPHRLVQNRHDGGYNTTGGDRPGQWVSADLQRDALEVNHYCLRHGSPYGGACRLQNWELQGRKRDGAVWVTLSKHLDDQALGERAFATAGWAVEGGKGAFSQFRLLMTGPNSGGYNYLLCAGMELYGTLLPG